MTRAEAIQTLQANAKLLHFEHPYLGIKEAIEVVIEALSQSPLPSDLDEAAEKYVKDYGYTEDDYKRERIIAEEHFKAGAEWMAGKYEKIEGELVDWYSTSDGKDYCCGVKTIDSFEAPEGFYIRKKQ